jgi:hypothetical protein
VITHDHEFGKNTNLIIEMEDGRILKTIAVLIKGDKNIICNVMFLSPFIMKLKLV